MNIVKKLSDNSKDYLNTYYEIIDTMQKNMTEANSTFSSISELFIKQHMSYATALTALSDNILRYTTNIDIENLAKQIINEQNTNVLTLSEFLEECTNCKNNERDINLYKRKFTDILTYITNCLNTLVANNNLNLHYLHSILIHHEGGINFAKNALSYNLCPELKKFLTELIMKNTAQIALIKQLLKNV